jgi:N-acetylglutamate synthase-like GNAT family acetyltransferase
MNIEGPFTGVEAECERVLRTLPRWFGIEQALLEYAQNTARLPTFVAKVEGRIVGFLSLQEHFPEMWEVNCVAVDSEHRGQGSGARLHARAE